MKDNFEAVEQAVYFLAFIEAVGHFGLAGILIFFFGLLWFAGLITLLKAKIIKKDNKC